MIQIPKRPLLCPFTSSYKKFITGYFNVTIRPVAEKDHFYDLVGNPLFAFYWYRCPWWYDKYQKEILSPDKH